MSRRKRWNRGKRWTRPRRRPRGVLDDPGRDEQRRWRRQACEVLAGSLEASPRDSAEPGNAGCAKRRRLLISLAAFLEPGHRRRLGAEGAWGVYRAFRELAERAPNSLLPLESRHPAGSEPTHDRQREVST